MTSTVRNVYKALLARKWHITFAESCTGGLAASTLVAISGSSSVFDGSFVTYANEAKVSLIGVSSKTIDEKGVVSLDVAEEMARGCAQKMNAEVGVGITGVAGPTGGTKDIPVGTVCFGFYINGVSYRAMKYFAGKTRTEVRRAAVDYVYQELNHLLK